VTFTPAPAGKGAASDPRDPTGFLRGADDSAAEPAERVDALDGIRALAVSLVVLFHLGVPGMAGGFLGVDVFFVLSGFLITTLLLRDIVANGRIDLTRFWARRMARLMPAALLVFLVIGVWALAAAPVFRRAGLGADLLWCLLYVGNWRFISTSSYFAFDGTTSPLLHLWSLGVEEQFYLIWPLVLQAVALLLAGMSAGRHARDDRVGARNRSTTAVMITGGVLAVVSAVLMAQLYVAAGPDRAYMGTDAKVFEPLLGAVFAAATLRPRVGELVRRYAQELMVFGLGALILAVALLGSASGPHPAYFFGGAVLTCLATVALVAGAANAPTDGGLGRLLANDGVTYLGRISYGVYLWHWPWAVWLLPDGRFNAAAALFVAAMTVASASVSYHLLELPLRTGRFRLVPPLSILRTGVVGIAVVSVIPVLLGGAPWYAGIAHSDPGPSGQASGAARQPRVMLVGDSVPLQLYGAFAEAGERSGVVIINDAHGGCAASGVVTVNPDGTPYDPVIPRLPGAPDGPICAGVIGDQKARVAKDRPTVVLWWSRYELGDFLGPGGKPVRAADPNYRAMQRNLLDAAVDRLSAGGATVVVVQPEPTGMKTADRCTADRRSEAAGECGAFLVRLRFDNQVRLQWIDVLREKAATDKRLKLVRVDDLFCRNQANPCDDRLPIAEDGRFGPPTPDYARPDGSHFAAEIRDRMAGEVLRRALAAAGSPSR
jgi:peptidoglycan/LPS O-acetylase OafA/YrhL